MLAYVFNVDKDNLCQQRLTMLGLVYVGIGDLCQHRFYMPANTESVKKTGKTKNPLIWKVSRNRKSAGSIIGYLLFYFWIIIEGLSKEHLSSKF